MKSKLYIVNEEINSITCLLCNHYCVLAEGQAGLCSVRINSGGEMISLSYGAANGFAADPIEKKPFFHFKPGTKVLSFGTPGCNFRCLNCQNSSLSQSVLNRTLNLDSIPYTSPADIVELAVRSSSDGIAYTYSEPTIFFEYCRDTVMEAKSRPESSGLYHVFISNGFFSKEMFDIAVRESLFDAMNIDLKFMKEENYRRVCSASLNPVLENIRRVHDAGIHLEIINLIIPGENDKDEDILELCRFISSVSKDIPVHFSRFFPRYKMPDKSATPNETLVRAKDIAKSEGIKYIYIGNSDLKDSSNTYCPACNTLLIERNFYHIARNRLKSKCVCPVCSERINIRI